MTLFIVIYMLFYAVIHSWLAGHGKNIFQSSFGERKYYGLYRLLYNVFAVIMILPVLIGLLQPSSIVWTWPSAFLPFLLIMQMIGAIGFVISLLQTDLLRFLGLKQFLAYLQNRPLPLPAEKMQVRGVYRLVRHPLYLFAMISMWSVPEMTANCLAFNFTVSVYFIVGAYFEERRLIATFGDAYLRYRKDVPAFLPVPRFSFHSSKET